MRGRELIKSLSGCRKRYQLISLKEDRERRDLFYPGTNVNSQRRHDLKAPVNLKEACMIEHFWRLEGKGYKLQGIRNLACHNCEGV